MYVLVIIIFFFDQICFSYITRFWKTKRLLYGGKWRYRCVYMATHAWLLAWTPHL